jgi:hypothetical protein
VLGEGGGETGDVVGALTVGWTEGERVSEKEGTERAAERGGRADFTPRGSQEMRSCCGERFK